MSFVNFGSGYLSDSQEEQAKQWVRGLGERPSKARAINYLHATFGITIPLARVGRLIDSALGVDSFDMKEPSKASAPEPDVSLLPQPNPTCDDPLRLPGYGLATAFMPDREKRFPVLVGDESEDWTARTLLIREVCMLKLMEDITNKPEWWRKVRDPVIAAKWKAEACKLDWRAYRRHADFTPAMANACMNELCKKAELYEQTGLIPVFDYSACVIKSDRLAPPELVSRLKRAVSRLEDVPEHRKDWHPGSDGKVLDLVHPSLYPLLYGRSRILRHQRIGLDDCLDFFGRGFIVPEPEESNFPMGEHHCSASLSSRFQWLPCDVVLGEDGSAKIESYINNLHPVEHAELYPIIQGFVEKSLPAWDLLYRWVRDFQVQRLTVRHAGRHVPIPDAKPRVRQESSLDGATADLLANASNDEPLVLEQEWERHEEHEEDEEDETDSDVSDDDDDESGDGWSGDGHYDDEEGDYDSADFTDLEGELNEDAVKASSAFNLTVRDIKSSGFFGGASRIQVIVKLANIHLTPENPSYDGGSWHIEGQLNEHICATALFYYDNENITESRLAFRTAANVENLGQNLRYEQHDWRSIERVFAIRSGFDTLQDVGSVLTRPGRALFFPNLFQHRVEPFALADRSRPGHRKILALFLVDPAIPVISTANVPPQQREWWPGAEAFRNSARFPSEVKELIIQKVEVGIGPAEAKRIREELMAERTVLREKTESSLQDVEWNFCEH